MKNQVNLDEFIPQMDTPEKVYQLFDFLGYKVLDTGLKTKPSVYNLPAKEASFIENIFAVANYNRRFQILLFKLKEDNKEAIRNIPEKILREVDYPFIIFTPDFKTFTFTLVEKIREGPGEFKRKLTKLIVDKDNPYHTDKEILGNLTLSADSQTPTEIHKVFQDAFSVERVTKKFFTEYRETFEKLTKEIQKQNKHLKFTLFTREGAVENFAKILLGRLMFLYFIQKRGWLNCFDGWGSGDKIFLYNKFQEAKREKRNYFKDYLEPLFFDTLNNPRRDKPNQATRFGGRIPFLNGGLFEPEYDYKDIKNHVLLENSTFDNVFSVFEKYNFTVKEDEPLEKEVAIDPEMLGKVFENLLEENLRKGKGAYYTPREIVHYMCHESLINYLVSEIGINEEEVRRFLGREQSLEKKETFSPAIRGKAKEIDGKLATIKVVDPACGSGAFLVGMLHEIISARLGLNRELGRSLTEYDLKKATIQNNIYGVDIDAGAVEIAKLRLWLTLVVDHNLSEIEPLPNLDYKIMVGNSLLEDVFVNGKTIKPFNYEFFRQKTGRRMKTLFEEEPQTDLFESLHWESIQSDVEKIIEKKNEIFGTFEFEKKQKIRSEINQLENELIRKSLRREAQILGERIQNERQKSDLRTGKENRESLSIQFSKKFLDDLIKDDNQLNEYKSENIFLWKLRFIEVFDCNDGFDVVIANPPYVRQEFYKDQKEKLKSSFGDFFNGRADLYTYFYKKGLDLLKHNAVLVFISSNKFFIRGYGENTRRLLTTKATLLVVINFGELPVFKAAVDSGIVIAKKKTPSNKNEVLSVQIKSAQEIENLEATVKTRGYGVRVEGLREKGWVFERKEKLDLLHKLRRNKLTLNNYCNKKIFAGIKTGFDKAFVITENIKEKIVKIDPKSAVLVRPWLRGKDVAKWRANYKNLYVIYIPLNKVKIDDYPAIKNHLLRFKKELSRRATQQKWYEMQQPQERFTALFDSPKIIYPDCAKEMRACYDTSKSYGTMAMYFIPYDPVILAILNSRLFDWYSRMTFATFGDPWNRGRVIFKSIYMRRVPIPTIPDLLKIDIEKVVKKIILITNGQNYLKDLVKQAKVREYEKQIDRLVYKLYSLTPEEIKIVEEFDEK